MEMTRFLVSGGVKLPIGFRFRPTDEELVVHYLRRKVLAIPLPASVIPELDVFGTDPWGLPGNLRERRYFFSRRSRSSNGRECTRVAAGFGYWKYKAKSKQILASDGNGNQVMGMRKTLVFCGGRHSICNGNGTGARWILHEFSLAGTHENSKSTTIAHAGDANWAVYRLFQKKMRPKRNGDGNLSHPKRKKRSSVTDLRSECIVGDSLSTPPPPSPCSSFNTDISSSGKMLDQEDISSSFR